MKTTVKILSVKILSVKIIVLISCGKAIVEILSVTALVQEEEKEEGRGRCGGRRGVIHRAGWAFGPPLICKPP